MSKGETPRQPSPPADLFALALQSLRGQRRLDSDQELIRINPRTEAASAPFQFDSAQAVLHRRGCRHIPAGSVTALYAVWRVDAEDLVWACKKCRPMQKDNQPERPADVGDLLLGILSLADQFGSVLTQRGRDFRRTDRGRQVEQSLTSLWSGLSQSQRDGLKFVTAGMDRLLSAVNRYNQTANGKPTPKPAAAAANARKPRRSSSRKTKPVPAR